MNLAPAAVERNLSNVVFSRAKYRILKLIYFEGCPNAEGARALLREIGVPFEEERQDELSSTDPLKEYASPTVLDGKKIYFRLQNWEK